MILIYMLARVVESYSYRFHIEPIWWFDFTFLEITLESSALIDIFRSKYVTCKPLLAARVSPALPRRCSQGWYGLKVEPEFIPIITGGLASEHENIFMFAVSEHLSYVATVATEEISMILTIKSYHQKLPSKVTIERSSLSYLNGNFGNYDFLLER